MSDAKQEQVIEDLWRQMFTAAHTGDLQAIGDLLKKDPDLAKVVAKSVQFYWHTPLHLCAKKGHVEAAALLIEARAKLEARARSVSEEYGDFLNITSLQIAAQRGYPQMVKLLLEAKANAKATTYSLEGEDSLIGCECTALTLAIKKWYDDPDHLESKQSLWLMMEPFRQKKRNLSMLEGLHARAGTGSILDRVSKRSSIFDWQILRLILKLGNKSLLPNPQDIPQEKLQEIDALFKDLSFPQAYGLLLGLTRKQVEWPWFTYRHAEAAARGKLYSQYADLTEDAACGVAYGLKRDQVTDPFWKFESGHAAAARAGEDYEQYKGLTNAQAWGMVYGLPRDQVKHDWFVMEHAYMARDKKPIAAPLQQDVAVEAGPKEQKRGSSTSAPSVALSATFPGFAQGVPALPSDDEEENTRDQEDQVNPGPATPASFS